MSACRCNTPDAHLGQGPPLVPLGFARRGAFGSWLGRWFHRRRYGNADADHDHRPWLSLVINQKIDGRLTIAAPSWLPFSGVTPASTTINLPDTVARPPAAPRPAMDPARHRRMDELEPHRHVHCVGARNRPPLPFQFEDGWLFSAGAEYQWNDRLTVRAGVGFEKSPITDACACRSCRTTIAIWLSIGGTYKLTPKITLDAAYSHVFVKDAPINITGRRAIRGGTAPTTSAACSRTSTSSRSA